MIERIDSAQYSYFMFYPKSIQIVGFIFRKNKIHFTLFRNKALKMRNGWVLSGDIASRSALGRGGVPVAFTAFDWQETGFVCEDEALVFCYALTTEQASAINCR